MAFNLNDYSEAEKYDLFRRVVVAANKKYGEYNYGDAAYYEFQREPGRVNLLGVRGLVDGKVKEPEERTWDDRIFIVFLDEEGNGVVKKHEAGTEHGSSADDATSLLLPGQHPYRLGYHRTGGVHKRLQWFKKNAKRNNGRG